jgi:DNA-binding transcriptional regulator YiaG
MTKTTLKLLIEARAAARTGSGVEIRQHAGLSQGELARAAGINPGTLSRWENRERQPTGAAAVRYARVLRVLAESDSNGSHNGEGRSRQFAHAGADP